jgi:hypothetical protein
MHPRNLSGRQSRLHWLTAAVAAIVAAAPAEARVTRIVIDDVSALTGQSIPYEQIRGRAFGELDPNDPHNSIVTDIKLGADADGKVRYETSFNLVKPVDMNRASGFLWHDVPNRGGAGTIVVEERELGDIGLRSGWQADNAGNTGVPVNRAHREGGWRGRHRQCARANRQSERPGLQAADGADEPRAVSPGHAGHDQGDAEDAHEGDCRRRCHRGA